MIASTIKDLIGNCVCYSNYIEKKLMNLKKSIVYVALTSVITLAAAPTFAGGHGVMVGSAEMVASKTIVANASASDELTVLVAAVNDMV